MYAKFHNYSSTLSNIQDKQIICQGILRQYKIWCWV